METVPGVRWAGHDGVRLAYRALGGPEGAPVLLICGNGHQMTQWPPALLDGLIGCGLRVAMFDNRDSGRSTHCADRPGYDLGDMASDALAVLDALGWARAHVVGFSLGGMIGQVLAVHHPGRVLSLTSISSAPGWGARISRPRVGTVLRLLPVVRRPVTDRGAAADRAVALHRLFGGSDRGTDEAWVRETAARAHDIDGDTSAGARQLAAIKASGDRRAELAGVRAPTLVVHGLDDPMQSPRTAGRATADAIPGARFLGLPGVGHTMPTGACAEIVGAIDDLVRAPRPA